MTDAHRTSTCNVAPVPSRPALRHGGGRGVLRLHVITSGIVESTEARTLEAEIERKPEPLEGVTAADFRGPEVKHISASPGMERLRHRSRCRASCA
ncbi:hypothetical protein BD309DRAFT_959019, partial [Dichomitus squalens]